MRSKRIAALACALSMAATLAACSPAPAIVLTPQPTPNATVDGSLPSATVPTLTGSDPAASALTGSPDPSAAAATAPLATATPAPTPSPTETPTPAPTPTPTPTPVPHPGDRADVIVTSYYESVMPAELKAGILYTDAHAQDRGGIDPAAPAPLDYFVLLKNANVLEMPAPNAKGILSVHIADRLPLIAAVTGSDGKVWYRVSFKDKDTPGIGYLPATVGDPRVFQVAAALEKVKTLKVTADLPGTVRIDNRKNKYPAPLEPGNKSIDAFKNVRDQAAPAYLVPDTASSFRYMPDGSLGKLLGTKGDKNDFAEVYFPAYDEVRYVPSKYVTLKTEVITQLTQAFVVDRKNQNIMVFEYSGGQWSIVSMCYVSTGADIGGYYAPTPLGDYFTAKQSSGRYGLGEFWGMADGAELPTDGSKIHYADYCPFAIRFSGGAYLHAPPVGVSYAEGSDTPIMGSPYEFSNCLGTTPQSHMCVRNYLSHAKFMYKWDKDGQAAVIVLE